MVAAPQAQTKRQFVMITPEELKLNYKAGVLNAQTYLLYLIKTQRTEGWEWRFNVEEFCRKWEIAERTFYDALSKLRVKKLISWRTGDSTVVVSWGREATKTPNLHSSDSPNSPNPDTVIAPQDVAEAPQNVAEALQDVANPLQDVAEEQHSNPCTANVPDSLQIYTNKKEIHTDNNVCGNKISEEEEELPQAANEQNLTKEESAETPLTAKERQDSGVPNENPGFDQSSAAPLNKSSKTFEKQRWVFPGTDQEKQEFLEFKASLLVRDKRSEPIESLSHALAWVNRYPEEATLLLASWREDKERKANHCASVGTSAETVPEFHQMPPAEHKALLEKFVHLGGNEFTKLCSWHKHWLKFALLPLGKKILDLNTETIQEIREVLKCQTL